MRNYKKALAGVLAATMVLGSSFAALASDATQTITGSGNVDVPDKSEVFDIVLPSIPDPSPFVYILDPKGVINKTGAEKYNNATFATGDTVYFHNTASATSGNAASDYSKTSDAIKVVNKSTMDVNIKVRAQVAESTKITMAGSDQFTGNSASLYLAIKDNQGELPITTAGVERTATITKGDPDNFEVKYENNKYTYAAKDGLTEDDFNAYTFQLTGACNSNGVWDGIVDNDAPAVTVVWTVTDPTGPQSYVSTTSITPTSNSVTVTLPTGVTVSSITLLKAGATSPVTMTSGNHYTLTGSTYAFTSTMVNNWKGGTLTFTYSDGKREEVTIPR